MVYTHEKVIYCTHVAGLFVAIRGTRGTLYTFYTLANVATDTHGGSALDCWRCTCLAFPARTSFRTSTALQTDPAHTITPTVNQEQ